MPDNQEPPESISRGYSASKDDLLSRLSKIEGQIRGIIRMVDTDRYCVDVITQIAAVQGALDKVELGLLEGHVRHCLLGHHGGPETPEEQTAEVIGVVARILRR